jgi:hypothetical protein
LKAAKVTLAITSCGRMDLLEKTLISFFKFNSYPIEETIIIDDSGGQFDRKRISRHIPGKCEFIINKKNIGQIKSIDKLYKKITTPYIFHCEDDWEFYQKGFIEKSLVILKNNPQILNVWLRAHHDTNGHPISKSKNLSSSSSFKVMEKKYRGIWSGFTFNPGLRRMSDYKLLAPFAEQPIAYKQKNKKIASELDLSILYERLGFISAITDSEQGFVRHIGWSDHVPQEWERSFFKKALVKVKNFIKKYCIRKH